MNISELNKVGGVLGVVFRIYLLFFGISAFVAPITAILWFTNGRPIHCYIFLGAALIFLGPIIYTLIRWIITGETTNEAT